MRAALYARVSTDLQRGNYSIPSQIKDMLSYAAQRGYTIVGDYFVNPEDGQDAETGVPAFVDDYTSTELDRPGLDACLKYIQKAGYDVLLVHTIDRLARDPYYRQTIEREFAARGARIEYVLGNYDETPEGEVRKDLDATFAKWENAKRIERTNRGKRRKAEMGKFVTGITPFGYRMNANEECGLEVVEEQAGVVQLIFKLYVEDHLSLYEISKNLTANGIKTYWGFDNWSCGTLTRMLRNTAYIGYMYYNKNKRDGKIVQKRDQSEWIRIDIPPLIPQEIFEAAGEILKQNKETLRKRPKRFYLLSGMIFCSECGHSYIAQVATPIRKTLRKGYRHRRRGGHCCDRWLLGKRIEPIIWNAVAEILFDPKSLRRGYEKMMESEKDKQSRQIKHLEILNVAIQKLLAKRTRLQQVYLDPDIGMSKEEYLQEKGLIEDQINAAQDEVKRIEKELSYVPSEEDLILLEEMAGHITETLGENLDIPETEKRRILKLLNIKVLVTPDGQITLEGFFYPPVSGLLFHPS